MVWPDQRWYDLILKEWLMETCAEKRPQVPECWMICVLFFFLKNVFFLKWLRVCIYIWACAWKNQNAGLKSSECQCQLIHVALCHEGLLKKLLPCPSVFFGPDLAVWCQLKFTDAQIFLHPACWQNAIPSCQSSKKEIFSEWSIGAPQASFQ